MRARDGIPASMIISACTVQSMPWQALSFVEIAVKSIAGFTGIIMAVNL
jgi:hypothetical protein